jgi:uncharacterized protein (DUF924 family)
MSSLPTSDILHFWFGHVKENETRSMWFDQSPDAYITETYKTLVDTINIDNYKQFITTTLDQIALLLIGDQFTRNIYRNDLNERT